MNTIQSFRAQGLQKGYTLIELSIGIAIVLALLGIALYVLPSVFQSQRSLSMESSVLTLQSNVKALVPGPDYSAVSNTLLNNADKLPVNLKSGTATMTNQWGGGVSVATTPVAYGGGSSNNAFIQTWGLVPTAECTQTIMAVSKNFVRITVGGAVVQDNAAGTTPTAATVATECTKATANTVVFTST